MDPIDIANQRLAKGEISVEEYDQIISRISPSGGSQDPRNPGLPPTIPWQGAGAKEASKKVPDQAPPTPNTHGECDIAQGPKTIDLDRHSPEAVPAPRVVANEIQLTVSSEPDSHEPAAIRHSPESGPAPRVIPNQTQLSSQQKGKWKGCLVYLIVFPLLMPIYMFAQDAGAALFVPLVGLAWFIAHSITRAIQK